jgi:hypothetical protein
MNTGQTIFALGALALLSTSIVSLDRGYNVNSQSIIQSKLGITAVSLASSFIEEASGKSFDQKTHDSIVINTNGLTPAAKLGREPGEVYPDSINDFDDFNNLTITRQFQDFVSTRPYGGGSFTVKCKVEYVDPGNPDVPVTIQTFHKKLSVTVTSRDMIDTVRSQFIFSYWYF